MFRVSILALEARLYRYRQRVVPRRIIRKARNKRFERERERGRKREREIRPRSRRRARSSDSISLERQSRGERERDWTFYPPLFSIEFFSFGGGCSRHRGPFVPTKKGRKRGKFGPRARGRGRRRSLRRERSADEGLTLGCVLILVLPHNIT